MIHIQRVTLVFYYCFILFIVNGHDGGCGHDRMVVGFTTTCAISADHL